MTGLLRKWADERGYLISWGEPSMLDQIREELERRRSAGEFDEDFLRQYLGEFPYLRDVDWPLVRTVGVIVMPRPAHVVTFQLETRRLETVVPPTYVRYKETSRLIVHELAVSLSKAGYRVAPLNVPLKSLAARLGLVTYGRNNITYAKGFGSFHQLVGFASDGDFGPTPEPATPGPALSQDCTNCSACRRSCPTGAIGDDRFLLHAERCLTFWNERQESWPDWLPASGHNSLVGCLACQEVCPQNAGLLRSEAVEEIFTAAETVALMADTGNRAGTLWDGIRAKLASIGLPDHELEIGRNLRALLAAQTVTDKNGDSAWRDSLPL